MRQSDKKKQLYCHENDLNFFMQNIILLKCENGPYVLMRFAWFSFRMNWVLPHIWRLNCWKTMRNRWFLIVFCIIISHLSSVLCPYMSIYCVGVQHFCNLVLLMLNVLWCAAFPSGWRRRGHELHSPAVCQSHRWGQSDITHSLASGLIIEISAQNSLCFYFSSAPVTPFSPLSSRTPWCSPSHSLKRETWEVWDSSALWGQAFWNTWFWLVY